MSIRGSLFVSDFNYNGFFPIGLAKMLWNPTKALEREGVDIACGRLVQRGWSEVMRETNMKEGDLCVFELIKKNAGVFVQIGCAKCKPPRNLPIKPKCGTNYVYNFIGIFGLRETFCPVTLLILYRGRTASPRLDIVALAARDSVSHTNSHTIGVGHCSFFKNRTLQFQSKRRFDPSLNSTYAAFLENKMPSLSDNTTIVPMEPRTPLSFDNNYYSNLKQRQRFSSGSASGVIFQIMDLEDNCVALQTQKSIAKSNDEAHMIALDIVKKY
ncbi:hypothetical protein IFM89_020729 [Coptis chinensis]|uniref:Plant heme peroxidase family profile domain-containing protein n=1 Tax=Coptis chinensis TaxID=261450 RepID=A0A835IBJ5_9MAGN|nr:hypothetical protein IFM89_020729 [Coptis chinensis]